MLDACTRRWVGRTTSEDEVRDRLASPHTTMDADTVVIADGDDVVGFGHIWPAGPSELRCFARTRPDRRGRGIGAALQERLVARAEELAGAAPDGVALMTTSWPDDAATPPLLEGFGYAAVRHFQRMVVDLADWPARPSPAPRGVTVRHYRPADDRAVFAAFVEAFADHWGEQHVDEDAWWTERRDGRSAGFDPGLWLVAEEEGEVAGFLTARTREDDAGRTYGYVGDLGVRPRWRGRGLGECLLTRSIGGFGELGLPYAALDVDTENTTGAVRLYEKIGMSRRPLFTIWRRPLAT